MQMYDDFFVPPNFLGVFFYFLIKKFAPFPVSARLSHNQDKGANSSLGYKKLLTFCLVYFCRGGIGRLGGVFLADFVVLEQRFIEFGEGHTFFDGANAENLG